MRGIITMVLAACALGYTGLMSLGHAVKWRECGVTVSRSRA